MRWSSSYPASGPGVARPASSTDERAELASGAVGKADVIALLTNQLVVVTPADAVAGAAAR